VNRREQFPVIERLSKTTSAMIDALSDAPVMTMVGMVLSDRSAVRLCARLEMIEPAVKAPSSSGE
jgi:hypothetical protein